MVRRFDVRIPRAFSDRGAPPKPASSEPASSEASGASLIQLGDARAPAPDSCACCGALAARAISAGDGAGRHLLVGYCDDCAAHVSRTATYGDSADGQRVRAHRVRAVTGGNMSSVRLLAGKCGSSSTSH